MIKCPHCGHDASIVRELKSEDSSNRRYRICKKCAKTFTTQEFLAVYAGKARGLVLDSPAEVDE